MKKIEHIRIIKSQDGYPRVEKGEVYKVMRKTKSLIIAESPFGNNIVEKHIPRELCESYSPGQKTLF